MIAVGAGDRPLAANATRDHALAIAEKGHGDATDQEIEGALELAGTDPDAIACCYIARRWAGSTAGRGALTLRYGTRAAEAQSRMPWKSPGTRVELLDLRVHGEALVGDFGASGTTASLGLVERLQVRSGDLAGAAATAKEAVPQLAATHGPSHPLTQKTQALGTGSPVW